MEQEIKNFLKIPEDNISKGWSVFDGHIAMQNRFAYDAIYSLIEAIRPDTIVEIGTAQCGLTRFLRRVCDIVTPTTQVISYDISKGPRKNDSITDSIDFRLENCFHIEKKPENIPTQQKLFKTIRDSRRCIVLCDGGSKIHEFNVIGPHMSSGDIIMAHDYAHSKDVYKSDIQGKFWNWNEIVYSDISKTVDEHNLEYYKKEQFAEAAWGCFIKR